MTSHWPSSSIDEIGFAYELAHDASLKEVDIVAAVTWFLLQAAQLRTVPLAMACDFIESHGIRAAINRGRLRKNIAGRVGLFRSKNDDLNLSLKERTVLGTKYQQFLATPKHPVRDTVLELQDFKNGRPYVLSLAIQINACRQFEIFDGCAVLMRRLMEVLIIDAYENRGLRAKITQGQDYFQLSGLVGALLSGGDFKLSRNARRWIERCKELGDNAAHSRTYLTRRLDIDDFSGNFRSLVAELQFL